MSAELPRAGFVEQIMGMPISVHVRGEQARGAQVAAAVERVFADLRQADALFSTYRDDSEVSRINAGTLAGVDAHPLLREVLALSVIARERTGGLFDVNLPAAGGRTFDPSGLVKGWAADRASRHLVELDGCDFCLNAGGDVVVGCTRPDAEPWRMGIEDPRPGGTLLGVVERLSGAVATSGTAARGAHLVDPRTGEHPGALLSVTVVGPSLTWADVLATAAFVRGEDAVTWLSGNLDYAALVVHADGRVQRTPTLRVLDLDTTLTPTAQGSGG